MILSASGVILRTRPLTETSLIVNWLTPNFGRLSTAAKGTYGPCPSSSGVRSAAQSVGQFELTPYHVLSRRTHNVDRDCVRISRDGECRGLAELAGERLEVGVGDRPDVEAREHRGRQRDEPDPEPVAPGRRDVLDKASLDEGRELARRSACARPQPPRDLIRAQRRLVGEDVEDGERPLCGGDACRRGLTGLGHWRSVSPYRMLLRRTG